jgi:hypothetical protein
MHISQLFVSGARSCRVSQHTSAGRMVLCDVTLGPKAPNFGGVRSGQVTFITRPTRN